MKIYLFNPETGFYLGEDFAEEAPMEPGAFVIPPDATTIAPPPSVPGQILVFNADMQRWGWEVHHRQGNCTTNAVKGQRSRCCNTEITT